MTCWITTAVASAWEEIAMDFVVALPRTQSGYDSIWVILDRLTKVAHFIPVKTTYFGPQQAELYMARIVCLHGVPKKIVSDRGTQFTLKFWERLQETLNTLLRFSSAYHPQTDGQTERVNQILENHFYKEIKILQNHLCIDNYVCCIHVVAYFIV
jgi:IS30 family transposase